MGSDEGTTPASLPDLKEPGAKSFAPLKMITRLRITDMLPYAVGGLFLGCAFPKCSFSGVVWVALIPLLLLCIERRNVFWESFVYGMAANGVIYHWVLTTCSVAHVNPAVGFLAWTALAAYHALYIAAFSYLLVRGTDPARHPIFWTFQAAALWTALEYVRAHVLTGLPWSLLANTQFKNLPVLQVAELAGPYGVSFLIVLVNAGLAVFLSRQGEKKGKLRGLLYPAIVLVGALLWGSMRLEAFSPDVPPEIPTLKVAILQGNIDQYQKWDDAYEQSIRDVYDKLVQTAAESKPDLIVWPETAVPGWFPNEEKYALWIWGEGGKGRTFQVVGAPTSINKNDYNAAFLISPEGVPVNRYLKTHLVPFGEFVPLRFLLAHLIKPLNDMGNFSAGKAPVLFRIPGTAFAVSICYEMIFPDLIRRFHSAGAQFLVNITNDGWFLKSSAPEQHMAANVLRAIENRAAVVRAANTGISCIIEPSGRIQAETTLLTRTVLVGEIVPVYRQTFYDRWGDSFAWLCLVGFGMSLAYHLALPKKTP